MRYRVLARLSSRRDTLRGDCLPGEVIELEPGPATDKLLAAGVIEPLPDEPAAATLGRGAGRKAARRKADDAEDGG